jgi:hypothetical protein
LQETGIDEKDIRIIRELYQTAKLKLNHISQTSNIRIVREVRQGYMFSSLVFNIYVEKIFQLAHEGYTTKIKVNGIPINLQYVDDIAILIENIQ